MNVVQVSGSSARQLKPLSTQAASRPTKDQCDDLQVNNQIVESNQELVIFRISVDNLSYGNNFDWKCLLKFDLIRDNQDYKPFSWWIIHQIYIHKSGCRFPKTIHYVIILSIIFSMAFESRIKVRTRVQLVDVNITTDCVCRDPCK